MKMLFKVNQEEALRLGIDAPSSTVLLDVDPTNLTQSQRDLLARCLWDGHDCTRPFWTDSGHSFRIMLTEPSVEGLTLELERIEREEQARVEARKEDATARIRAALTTRREREIVQLDKNGGGTSYPRDAVVSTTVEVPMISSDLDGHLQYVDGDLRAQYEARKAEAIAERERILDAARERLLPELRAKLAERAEAARAQKDAYDQLYQQLPEVLRQRDAAGFAPASEIEGKLKALLCERLPEGWERVYKWEAGAAESLTDRQYKCLSGIRESIAALNLEGDVDVEPVSWAYHRPAEDTDDPEDIDHDDEVYVNNGTYAKLVWHHPSGVSLTARWDL